MPAVTFKLKRIRFELNVGFALLVVAVAAVMLWAGFWQLDRAAQKIAIQQSHVQALNQPVLELSRTLPQSAPEWADIRYRQVQLTGRYLPDKQFLLDNRVFPGVQGSRVGYHVITPFELEDSGGVVLVNRGWLPASPDRSVLPDIRVNARPRTISGIVDIPGQGYHIGTMDTDSKWPRVIQFVGYSVLAERLGFGLHPALIVLAEGEPDSYTWDWEPVVEGPQKHYAYAVQWFLMCLAVLILFIYFSRKREHE
jgi:surfeit locus 1 family protein